MDIGDSSNRGLLRIDLQTSLKRSPLNPKDITPFQRILLTTDGMVTEMLEAYLWERMKVIKLFQGYFVADNENPFLEIAKGCRVMQRKVLLCGRLSQKNHLYADSIIIPDRLDERIKDSLLNTNKPIGLLILENRLETFREILDCGKEEAEDLADYFNIRRSEFLIFRTYRVFSNRLPIMLITEKFPESGMRI
ncbi:MAG: chorismate pyruvate-lyase family protein [Candidatus Brocadia sp.]|uniref:Chorismate pyruvate-lyase n=1 Tax=Candidatus Brocadia fulgida TaxID=380242 RepID=A0A0M2UXS5_9BACT|nr:MAG: Chorismate pyruvate-lyase [Candidatus Brocadia fulgida]UJS20087.1 MAG: chorismate pyruvate-lyase family protein [Candidatus Brocadia sp.]